jgi:hypothetical protein
MIDVCFVFKDEVGAPELNQDLVQEINYHLWINDMAANVSMSLSFAATTPSLLGVSSSSKRLVPFSALPYPSFSLRTSNSCEMQPNFTSATFLELMTLNSYSICFLLTEPFYLHRFTYY